MIADSPYTFDQSALGRFAGSLVGLVAGGLMLSIVGLLQEASGITPKELLVTIGSAMVPNEASLSQTTLAVVGGFAHGCIAVALGILYSSSQERAPVRGLIAVGFFFGIMLWVLLGSLGEVLSDQPTETLRTWPWLIANLAFGLCLAVASVAAKRWRRADSNKLPLD